MQIAQQKQSQHDTEHALAECSTKLQGSLAQLAAMEGEQRSLQEQCLQEQQAQLMDECEEAIKQRLEELTTQLSGLQAERDDALHKARRTLELVEHAEAARAQSEKEKEVADEGRATAEDMAERALLVATKAEESQLGAERRHAVAEEARADAEEDAGRLAKEACALTDERARLMEEVANQVDARHAAKSLQGHMENAQAEVEQLKGEMQGLKSEIDGLTGQVQILRDEGTRVKLEWAEERQNSDAAKAALKKQLRSNATAAAECAVAMCKESAARLMVMATKNTSLQKMSCHALDLWATKAYADKAHGMLHILQDETALLHLDLQRTKQEIGLMQRREHTQDSLFAEAAMVLKENLVPHEQGLQGRGKDTAEGHAHGTPVLKPRGGGLHLERYRGDGSRTAMALTIEQEVDYEEGEGYKWTQGDFLISRKKEQGKPDLCSAVVKATENLAERMTRLRQEARRSV